MYFGEMFGSGSEAGNEGSGIPGQLYPTRFMWPHGGRIVCLIGSFTRWTEHIPMSPMEGCPSVFQVMCSLPKGYHQFKFYVDGEWRHDENQEFVTGNHGIVNIVRVPIEQLTFPTIFGPAASGRPSHMDVDEAFNQPIMVPRANISEVDLEVSRHRISTFLSTSTAYELLPESGKIVTLDVNLPVKQAFHILHEQGISVAPLWDSETSQFVGILSALDFIIILRELGNHGSNLTDEELETRTISAWKEAKMHLNRQNDASAISCPRHLVYAESHHCLKDIALKFLQNEVATIPIIDPSRDGSFPRLLHLATLSGILKCICRNFKHSSSSLPILQLPIYSIRLGTWVPEIAEFNQCTSTRKQTLEMLNKNAFLSDALSLLVQAKVSSIPIVDENYSLIDVYSRSDITALAKDNAYAQIRLDQTSVLQALQLGQDANYPYTFLNAQRCQMCLRSDSLLKVMEQLSNPGVRRLVIVEAGSKRVEGIISLSDVFRFLLGV